MRGAGLPGDHPGRNANDPARATCPGSGEFFGNTGDELRREPTTNKPDFGFIGCECVAFHPGAGLRCTAGGAG